MIPSLLIFVLTFYFALFLGISGLAKIERPFVSGRGKGWIANLTAMLLGPIGNRLLGVLELTLAILLVFGVLLEYAVIINMLLFLCFFLFKIFLRLTNRGSDCGCFGTHVLVTVDKASIVSSIIILAIAGILVYLVQVFPPSQFQWLAGSLFIIIFGWLSVKVFRRWLKQRQTLFLGAFPNGRTN